MSTRSPPPWLTGPLLAPSGHVVPKGHVNFEPYLFFLRTNHVYDGNWNSIRAPSSWTINLLLPLHVGLTKWCEVFINPSFLCRQSRGVSSIGVADLLTSISFQLLMDVPESWYPSIRFVLRETFPIGKYQNLDSRKNGTDGTGLGSFVTTPGIVISRLFHICEEHWLATRLSIFYAFPTSVPIKGVSVYGSGANTDGTVYLPQNLQFDLGAEYTLSRNWALAIDVVANFIQKKKFTGFEGVVDASDDFSSLSPHYHLASLASGPGVQYSLAPALEYNWNEQVGVIGGAWFTIAGKNASSFAGGVFAINYFY